jgi:hypothetical protein
MPVRGFLFLVRLAAAPTRRTPTESLGEEERRCRERPPRRSLAKEKEQEQEYDYEDD